MPQIPVNQATPGQAVIIDGSLNIIISMEHVKPGKGPAYRQTKFKNVDTGRMTEKRLRTADQIEVTDIDRQSCTFSYRSGESFVFMNSKTYEEIEVHESMLGADADYLLEGMAITVSVAQGRVVVIEIPPSVELDITACDPGVKNATATNVFKNAVVETGLDVQVPSFINVGDKVKIDTKNGKYLERVKIG